MDISLLYKIAGIGIVISLLNIFLNQAGRSEQAHLLNMAGVVLVILMLAQYIVRMIEEVESVFRWR